MDAMKLYQQWLVDFADDAETVADLKSIADNPAGFLIAYIAAVDAFTGLVSILHSLESKRNGSLKWRYDFIFGLVSMLLAVIVLIGGFVLKRPYVSVCAYAFGLIYSSIMQIASAFRRNAIVYIA